MEIAINVNNFLCSATLPPSAFREICHIKDDLVVIAALSDFQTFFFFLCRRRLEFLLRIFFFLAFPAPSHEANSSAAARKKPNAGATSSEMCGKIVPRLGSFHLLAGAHWCGSAPFTRPSSSSSHLPLVISLAAISAALPTSHLRSTCYPPTTPAPPTFSVFLSRSRL